MSIDGGKAPDMTETQKFQHFSKYIVKVNLFRGVWTFFLVTHGY